MQDRPIIGIVSGMGPAAGLDLAEKIIMNTQARSDREHIPVVLMSYPSEIPDRSPYLLEGIEPNPADAVYEIIRDLDSAGATVAGIPCNTAHAPAIFDELSRQLEEAGCAIRVVHMVDETVRALSERAPPRRRVGVLSTRAVRDLAIYSGPLASKGLEVIQPSDDLQDRLVTPAIFSREYGLKAVSPATSRSREDLLEALSDLKARGATAVILGCTELPLAIPEPAIDEIDVVDPTLILARALIEATYPERLIQPVRVDGSKA